MDDIKHLEVARARVAALQKELASFDASPLPMAEIESRVDAVLDAACAGIPRPAEELTWFIRHDSDPQEAGSTALRLLNTALAAAEVKRQREDIKARLLSHLSRIVADTKAAQGSDRDFNAKKRAYLLNVIKAAQVLEEQVYRRLRGAGIGGGARLHREGITGHCLSDEYLAALAETLPDASDLDDYIASDASDLDDYFASLALQEVRHG